MRRLSMTERKGSAGRGPKAGRTARAPRKSAPPPGADTPVDEPVEEFWAPADVAVPSGEKPTIDRPLAFAADAGAFVPATPLATSWSMPAEPAPVHAVPIEARPAEPSAVAVARPVETAVPAPGFSSATDRGLPWLSALGWVVFAIGLVLPVYMYTTAAREGVDYTVAGINGTYIATAFVVIGLALGLVFLFVPANRPSAWAAPARETIEGRLVALRTQIRMHVMFSIVGLALVAIGLLFAAWVRVQDLRADEGIVNLTLAGVTRSFDAWVTVGLLVFFVGLVVALPFYFRIGSLREAVRAAGAALGRAGPGVAAPAMAAAAPGPIPGEVNKDQLVALMRRIDALLAQLPEDAVSEFSKSPESDTYLRILGSAGLEPETAKAKK